MNIFRQSALDADRFTLTIVMDFALVNAVAALPQDTAKLTKTFKQHRQIAVLHVATGTQPHIFQLRRRHLPDAGNFRQRQRPHKLRHLMRGNDELAIRLVHI